MHLIGDITLGNLVTILITALSAAYAGGKLSHVLTALAEDVAELKDDFKGHVAADHEEFAKLHDRLYDLRARKPDARTTGDI